MENKQKPSLFLVENHLKIMEPGIPFMEDMLTWTIASFVHYPEKCVDTERNTILISAISALSQLSPFVVKISLGVEIENKLLCYQKRTWGKIFLNGENVLTFSHHSKKENHPFFELAEWAELPEDNPQKILAQWSVRDWIRFFKEKIIARAMYLKNKAIRQNEEAKALEESADKILISIVENSFN